MTQKIFKIEVKGTIQLTTHKTRNEALDSIFTVLRNNENYNLQDFRIIEEEQIDPEATLIDAANKIAERLSLFGEFKTSNRLADGSGWIEIRRANTKYQSWNSVEMERIMETMFAINHELPEGYSVFFSMSYDATIMVFLHVPEDDNEDETND